MTGDHSQLINFVQKFLGTVKFRNDHVVKIMGYSDYQIGNVIISRVYYVEGLGHNLFSVGQFSCAMGKSTKKRHKPKSEDTNQEKLYLLHMDLCGPMRVESVNGKKYILVIVDDYSRFTWVKFLRSKDETPMFIIKFLKMIQVRLNVPVRRILTDNGIEFVNQTLRDYYEERLWQPLVLLKIDPSFAFDTARPLMSFCTLQPKADIGIFIGYAPTKKAFRIYNQRTRRIVETIHVDFDELTAMASEQRSSGPALNDMTPGT
nr:integrase, catalytic region, zinc finger, CCHC-type, peptidase aspartic, catalytic [Tanacetum cinerariifolium]